MDGHRADLADPVTGILVADGLHADYQAGIPSLDVLVELYGDILVALVGFRP